MDGERGYGIEYNQIETCQNMTKIKNLSICVYKYVKLCNIKRIGE